MNLAIGIHNAFPWVVRHSGGTHMMPSPVCTVREGIILFVSEKIIQFYPAKAGNAHLLTQDMVYGEGCCFAMLNSETWILLDFKNKSVIVRCHLYLSRLPENDQLLDNCRQINNIIRLNFILHN